MERYMNPTPARLAIQSCFQAYMKRVTYKPGWTFDINDRFLDPNRITLWITMIVPDSTGQCNNPIPVSGMAWFDIRDVDPDWDIERLYQFFGEFLHREIVKMELHDVDEFLKVDNRCLKNPHSWESYSPSKEPLNDSPKELVGLDYLVKHPDFMWEYPNGTSASSNSTFVRLNLSTHYTRPIGRLTEPTVPAKHNRHRRSFKSRRG